MRVAAGATLLVLVWTGSALAQGNSPPPIVTVTGNPHGTLDVSCSTCHLPESWTPVRVTSGFHHAPKTFPLEGAHARTSCTSCHERLDFKGVSTRCASCHEDVHKGELGFDCSRCHTPRSFAEEPDMKRAHELTRFPLRGAHAAASCTACHLPGEAGHLQFVNRGTTCSACHAQDAAAVQYPDHKAAGFTTECTACHSIDTWKNPRFDHSQTAFPLLGAHQAATCDGCHADKVYQGKDTQCVACHRTDYDAATTPRHADGFPTTCTDCHTSVAWTGATFDHGATQFPLTGAHRAVTCAGCHADQVFRGKSLECASCHQATFTATTNPNHAAAGFTAPCTSCHTTTAWNGAPFDHDGTDFKLTGAHRTLTCATCHGDNVFDGRPTSCVSCHQANYNATTKPPHGAAGYATTCTDCHGTSAWLGSGFTHTAKFPLTGAHQATSCLDCHGDGVYSGRSSTCVSCHQADYNAAKQPSHAGFPTDCASCHATTAWAGATFDHGQTAFPLTGAHQAQTCVACHGDGVYRGKPKECVSCHQADYNGTTTPPHGTSGIGSQCSNCHTTSAWPGAAYDHSVTTFPLTGAHLATSCASCHGDGVYHGKPSTCVSCHQADYSGATKPSHAGFPTTCADCHGTSAWFGGTGFDHNATDFPLTGAHLATSCLDCHGDGVYNGKPTTCVSCHQANYTATTTPPHGTSGIGTNCTTCHVTTAWTGATYDHSVTTFPLTGAHRAATCASCHGNGVYHGKPSTCVSCHQSDYDGATTPSHAGFPTDCASCHGTTNWSGAAFDHATTGFALTGAHLAATCLTCHGDGVYKGKPSTCISCHQADYDRTTSPAHAAAGYSTGCTTCHTTSTWAGATFDHNATAFPLNGAHQAATCADCHGDGVYQGKPTACVSCHQADYNATTTPPHGASGIGTTCTSCHTTSAWHPGTYDHGVTTFPLTGAHLAATCADCHGDGVYHGKPTACLSCHQADYNGTTNPPHAAAGYSTTCTACHTTATWAGAVFDHNTTAFPLTGAHLAVNCQLCHGDGVYKGKPTACVSCHQADYNATTSPPHGSSGIGTTCTSCHTTTAWQPGTYDHNATTFPLTGAHTAATCAQCHGDGVYHGKPTTCVSCHQADYTATTNPNHAAAGFPTTCTSCHTTTTWTGATFNHDASYFPIYSGNHKGRWASCATCHTSPTSFVVFTCLTCHEHNKTSMDNKHQGRSGYAYDSQKCYACHPRGRS